MRVVAQRVSSASVEVDGEVVGAIKAGLLLFVGVGQEDVADGRRRAVVLADKVADLRIFRDSEGKSNLSLLETGGSALVISRDLKVLPSGLLGFCIDICIIRRRKASLNGV